jgi:hypothetical protein
VDTSQNPDASSGPAHEMCRYTATAVAAGAAGRSSHSSTKSTPLAANIAGTSAAGDRRRVARELSATRRIEQTDVATSIVGSAV